MKDLPNPDTDTAAVHEIGTLYPGVYSGVGLARPGQQCHLLAMHPDRTGGVPGGHPYIRKRPTLPFHTIFSG